MPRTHRKSSSRVPPDYFAWEAAGLRWLAEAATDGGAQVAEVHEVTETHLDLTHIDQAPPSRDAAEDLGRALARTHDASAPAFGSPPSTWAGTTGYLGPLSQPLPLSIREHPTWGAFCAHERIAATLALPQAATTWTPDQRATLHRLSERLAAGIFDDDHPPARIHGDLWAGNVLWSPTGAVLIDPAAHGGHRETDLAMLALFGSPHLEATLAAYAEIHPLTDGWRERITLHQVHPLMMHAVLFGGGYIGESLAAARRYL